MGAGSVEIAAFREAFDWDKARKDGRVVPKPGGDILAEEGAQRSAGLRANDCIIIYAETAREWMLAAQGAFTQGVTVVTISLAQMPRGWPRGGVTFIVASRTPRSTHASAPHA